VQVTIVTPCLNARATIEQALASVRDQGVEHVVVDGGSTDGTLDVLRAAEGLRWISEPDDGLADAMNKGIAMATGEVIGQLNADDVLLPGAVDRVRAAFAQRPQAEWLTAPCLIVDADGREIRSFVTRYKRFFLRRYSRRSLLVQNYVQAPSTFVRRSAYAAVGPYDGRFRYSLDYDMWLRLAERGDPIVLDEPLSAFTMAEGSLSMSGFERQFAEHAQNAREHGAEHPWAVRLNAVTSRAIVLAYRAMRAARAAR
jgi:glycosyltransferase involved in cell wall biosynthesis